MIYDVASTFFPPVINRVWRVVFVPVDLADKTAVRSQLQALAYGKLSAVLPILNSTLVTLREWATQWLRLLEV